MPQLVLEFSSNILEKDHLSTLFQSCHERLERLLPTDINHCKSRAIECTTYCVGKGHATNAFVHVSLKIMPGRSIDTLNHVAEELLSLFKKYFADSLEKLTLQITLEIIELQKTYFKLSPLELKSNPHK